MAASPETILLTLAGVIVLGFLGQVLFRASKVSDILILIAFGVLLRFAAEKYTGLDTQATFSALAPIVGIFALLVILFEGGIGFQIKDLIHGLGRAFVLAILGFGFTVAAVAAVLHYGYAMDWLQGLLLGSILGGSSSIAVMPIVRRLPIHEHTRVVLSVESALTDVFCVVGAITFGNVLALKAAPDVAGVGQDILSGFIVSIAAGLGAGLLWLKILDSPVVEGVRYMLTLAVILLLHVTVQVFLGANGPVAVLTFGVVLGNALLLRKWLKLHTDGFDKSLRAFQGEVAFVTRAFFFVYLGLLLDVEAFDLQLLRIGLLLLAALAVARMVAVLLSATGSPRLGSDRAVMWSMMPRGLAAAVLATVPSLTFGIPGTERFVAYAAAVIVLTNVVASFAGFVAPKLPGPRRVADEADAEDETAPRPDHA